MHRHVQFFWLFLRMCAWAPNYLVTYSGISRQDCPPGVGPVVDTGGVSRFGRRIMLGRTPGT